MRIIFVRHGHPDYAKDTLTPLGNLQAEAVAERLRDEKIDQFHASSCGRAHETALHVAKLFGMEVTTHDFMREIGWGAKEGEEELVGGGQPWSVSAQMVSCGESIMDSQWQQSKAFSNNRVTDFVTRAAENFDAWLSTFGYNREGDYYRVMEDNGSTVLMASHAGSSSAVLSHLFNLPFSFVCAAMPPNFTSVTIVSINGEAGALVTPKFEVFNDWRHIRGLEAKIVYE